MKTKTKESVRPKIFQSPAAAAAAASVTAAFALTVTSKDLEVANGMHTDITVMDGGGALEELQELEGKLAQANSENSRLRENVNDMNLIRADLQKVKLLLKQ